MRHRRHKARDITEIMNEAAASSVLFVGVSPRDHHAFVNVVEREVAAAAESVTASGLLDDAAVGRHDTGADWETFVCADGRSLPFGSNTFDLVVSNAIIEHVGDADDQRQFVAEHLRVANDFVLTTPNRWFPIEAHHRVAFKHWRRSWWKTQTLFTRLLSLRDLRALVPAGSIIRGRPWSPTFMATSVAVPRRRLFA
ncbi:MAG: methyltransferase domain-containing protein [Acidimicrobiales bacterium]